MDEKTTEKTNEKENTENKEKSKVSFSWKEIAEPERKKRKWPFSFEKLKAALSSIGAASEKSDRSTERVSTGKSVENGKNASTGKSSKSGDNGKSVSSEKSGASTANKKSSKSSDNGKSVSSEKSSENLSTEKNDESTASDKNIENAASVESVSAEKVEESTAAEKSAELNANENGIESAESVSTENNDDSSKSIANAESVSAEKTDESAESVSTEKTDESTESVSNKKGGAIVKIRKLKPLTKVLIALFFFILVVSAGVFTYAYFSVPNIDTKNSSIYSNVDLSSIIYDSKGEEIDKLYYTEDREIVSIKDIPEDTKNAFIAIEDKTFYRHHGLNIKRIFGAILSKLTGHSEEISGTSTITQQLARNVFLADIKSQRSLSRKFREMIYALKIERAYSKDEILEAYLNTIYLGYGCYGIKAAAYTYFGKDVSELDLAESAALAALPQAPDSYALLKDEKDENTTYMKKYGLYANNLSTDRRDLVLDLMAEQGLVDADKAEKAKMKMSKLLHPHIEKKPKELTYFIDYLTDEVAEDIAEKYSMTKDKAEQMIHTGGLRIYSTVDQDIQNAINTEFSDDWNFPYSEEDPQAAMVVTEVATGNIRAMVGGRNTSGQMLFNRATSPRQPGSSIKPLAVYSAALQKSEDYAKNLQTFPFIDYGIDRQGIRYWGDYITAGSIVYDEPLLINNEVWPLNFSRRFSGYRTFRTALQQSINTCAVKIQLQVGAEYSMEMLKKYGISTVVDDSSRPVNDLNPAALALGAMTYGVTPLDMSLAYATFANGGMRHSGASYTKVTNARGKVILEKETEMTKVLDEGVAFIMRDCLESVVTRGIAGNASIYGVPVGGKTGTTNDNFDYWFVGFTPKYSAALWIGTDHNTVMSGSSGTAALLWSRIMSQVPDIAEGEYPPQPSDVVNVYGEYYTEKTQP